MSMPCASPSDTAAGAVKEHLSQLQHEVCSAEAHAEELWASASPSHELGDDVVELNVGGDTGFVLSRTQCSFLSGSLLEALTSGRLDSTALHDNSGRIFIDLDPEQFRAILDWVFDGSQSLPASLADRLPEPYRWGLELLIQHLGLGREQMILDRSEMKYDLDDSKAYTFRELESKYWDCWSPEVIREYWLHDMQPLPRPPPPSSSHENVPPLSKCGGDEELAVLLEEHVRAALAAGEQLRDRLKKAESKTQRFHSEKDWLERLFGGSTPDDIVYFNAGGRVMATTRATLTHFDSSMLAMWLGRGNPLIRVVRIEQDSEAFAAVLQLLRFHRLFGAATLPPSFPCREAKLPVLCQILSDFELEDAKREGKGEWPPPRAATIGGSNAVPATTRVFCE